MFETKILMLDCLNLVHDFYSHKQNQSGSWFPLLLDKDQILEESIFLVQAALILMVHIGLQTKQPTIICSKVHYDCNCFGV